MSDQGLWPEDPNAPPPAAAAPPADPTEGVVLTDDEQAARTELCLCGRLPFWLGTQVCPLHERGALLHLVNLHRLVASGRLAGDTEPEGG